MLRNLAVLALLFMQVWLSASDTRDEAESKQSGLSLLLEQAGDTYRYVQEAYSEAVESIVTSQPWKTASESMPTALLKDSLSGIKETVTKVKEVGKTVLGFAGMYYEDYIQPVTSHYIEQTSNTTSTVWEAISKRWDQFWQF